MYVHVILLHVCTRYYFPLYLPYGRGNQNLHDFAREKIKLARLEREKKIEKTQQLHKPRHTFSRLTYYKCNKRNNLREHLYPADSCTSKRTILPFYCLRKHALDGE